MSNIVKIEGSYYDFGTKNSSFLITAQELKTIGIKHYFFMLEVKHPEFGVQDIDPYNPQITPENIGRLVIECKENPWFFFREVARVPVSGAGKVPLIMLRPSAAAVWCFIHSIDFLLCQPRQTYKSTWCTSILSYMFLFEYNNVNIPLLHLKLDRALKSVEQLRDYIDALPPYMVPWSDKSKPPGTKSLKYEQHSTSIVPIASADSDTKAGDLIRGLTVFGAMFEEYEYLKHFMSIMEGATPAIISGREIGRANNVRTCVMYLSTPGNLETEEGRQAQRMIDMTPRFNEQMYDFTAEDLANFLKGADNADEKGTPQPITSMYIEFDYRQCRKTEAWVREQYMEAVKKQRIDEYKRGVLLQRYRGGDAVLFEQKDIDYIVEHVREPDHKIFLLKKYELYVYDHQIYNFDLTSDTPYFDTQIPYLIGNDVAGGGAGDNTTFCIVQPYTLQVVGELTSPYIGSLDHMRLIIELAKLIPRGVFCLETNSIGKTIVDFVQESQLESRFYHDTQLDISKNAIIKETNTSVIMKHKANQKKYIGTYVTQKVRDDMMKLLIRYVKEYRHLINTKYLVKDITNLERDSKGKIAAADKEHDDMVMAYLHTLYVLHFGKDLMRFGIDKTKCTYEKVYDELKAYDEHITKETVNNAPDSNPGSFENQMYEDLTNPTYGFSDGGFDMYGYTHDQYNGGTKTQQHGLSTTNTAYNGTPQSYQDFTSQDYASLMSINSFFGL